MKHSKSKKSGFHISGNHFFYMLFMKDTYNMLEMTTTYIYGNEHAKHIYEKIGFVETDIVDEVDCHEVNMVYDCR